MEFEKNTAENSSLVAAREEASKAYAAAQKRYQTESAGLCSNDGGEDATLNDQLIAARNEISQAETNMKNGKMKIAHSQSELKKRRSEMKAASGEHSQDMKTVDNVSRQISQMQVSKLIVFISLGFIAIFSGI